MLTSHAGIVNLLTSHHHRLMGTEASRCRVGQLDESWEPVLWMLAGHELHVIPETQAVVGYLDKAGIDVLTVRSADLEKLIEAGLTESGLSVLLIDAAGGCVGPELWQRICAVPSLVVHELYGTKETSEDAYGWHGDASGGREAYRIDGVRTYVLGADLRPVPAGVTGELYIAGAVSATATSAVPG